MSKEMQLLKSKMEFLKRLINVYDELNFVTKSNKFDYEKLHSQISHRPVA